MPFKRGKLPARPGAIKFGMAQFLTASALPPIPAVFGHSLAIGKTAWGLFANDKYGDCVWAGAAHETMLLGKEAGSTFSFSDASVLSDYTAATGFNPANPMTDQGTDVQAAAEYRVKTGIVDAQGNRHKIAAYLALEPGNIEHLYAATYLFGAVGIGLALPDAADQQFSAGKPWDVAGPPGGGHYVPLVGKRPGMLHVITWGARQDMTEAFLQKYCDEAVAYVSAECLVNQKSPEGSDYDQLISDLKELAA